VREYSLVPVIPSAGGGGAVASVHAGR
jgi:hypothetical protein